MTPDKVLYTDGHDVTVTDTSLQVKKQEYKILGITKCVFMVKRPERAPGIVLTVLGLALLICGLLQVFNPQQIPGLRIGNQLYEANTVALWAGGILTFLGILLIALVRERYAVRIATAEGEKDAVVSSKREYITQIVDAINQSVSFVRTKPASRYFTVKSDSPS